jgi:hypothetical protein
MFNPSPFGYYYRAFIDSLLENERLLVIGYGARDEHLNTWLTEFGELHGDRRRVGWITLLPGNLVGENTVEKQIVSCLAGPGKFQDPLHYHHEDKPTLYQCGSLALIPSGFPTDQHIEEDIIAFLR